MMRSLPDIMTLVFHQVLALWFPLDSASALPFIILQGTTTMVIAVPLTTMKFPEDYLKCVKTLTDGVKLLKKAIHSVNDRRLMRQLESI
jgi:hypothetical protein